MTKEECIIKACQVIRKRVRFDGASIALPTTPFPGDDTKAIREATRLYVESWIVPLLDSIECGDMTRIWQYYEFEKGHEMESPNAAMSDRADKTAGT